MKKLIKSFKKHWKVNACWVILIVWVSALGVMIWSIKDNRALRDELKDSKQTLKECQYSFVVWDTQIDSGSVKIIKEDGTTERWEMKRGWQVGDEVGK